MKSASVVEIVQNLHINIILYTFRPPPLPHLTHSLAWWFFPKSELREKSKYWKIIFYAFSSLFLRMQKNNLTISADFKSYKFDIRGEHLLNDIMWHYSYFLLLMIISNYVKNKLKREISSSEPHKPICCIRLNSILHLMLLKYLRYVRGFGELRNEIEIFWKLLREIRF